MADGSVLVAEIATGSVTARAAPSSSTKAVVASGLAGPVQMTLGKDGVLYVTEAAGKLVRITRRRQRDACVASGLALPEGVAQTPWGTFIVAEAATARLVEIDPASGTRRTVAENLPIGRTGARAFRRRTSPTGVAVGADGTIYFSANKNNAIYRVRPMR